MARRAESLLAPLPLTLLVLLVIAVPILVVGELEAQDTRSRVRTATLDELSRTVERGAASLADRIALFRKQVASASTRSLGGQSTPLIASVESRDTRDLERQLETISSFMGGSPIIDAIFVLDVDGRLVAREPGVTTVIGKSHADREYFRNVSADVPFAIARPFREVDLSGGNAFLTGSNEISIVALSGWLPGRDRVQRLGVLVVFVDVRPLSSSVTSLLAAASDIYVFDGEGRLLTRATKAFSADFDTLRDLHENAVVASAIRGERVKAETSDPVTGEKGFLASARVTGTDWSVVAVRSPGVIERELEDNLSQQRTIRTFLVGLLLIATYLVGRTGSRLASANDQLRQASDAKSRFIAALSHDLRTPLNAILGFSELLLQRVPGALNEKQADYVKDIHSAGEHQLVLVNDLLDLSKIEAGRMELNSVPFSLPELIQSAHSVVAPLASAKQLRLEFALGQGVDTIENDPARVRQVLLNLLSNAIKFTPHGGAVRTQADARDGLLTLSVTDTGIGIRPEDQQAVFEEFKQVGDSARSAQGTGLGLALVNGLVRLMGGRVSLRSALGEGSTFTIELPVRLAPTA